MKYILKYGLFILFISLMLSCSDKVYKSAWQSQSNQTVADSKPKSPSYSDYNNETDLYYTISNDLDNFYIFFKTNNQKTQGNILRSGILFSIDTTGKYGERCQIIFPYEIKQKKISDLNGKSNTTSKEKEADPESYAVLKKKYIDNGKMMHFFGFKYPIFGAVPLPNDFGINMQIDWDSSNTMVFKAIIPFNTFYKKQLAATDSSKIFAVSLKITGLQPPPTYSGMGPMMGTGLSMGMGGMGGFGGMGMGMGYGGMGGMSGAGFGMRIPIGGNGYGNAPTQVDNTIKMKVKLALRPPSNSNVVH